MQIWMTTFSQSIENQTIPTSSTTELTPPTLFAVEPTETTPPVECETAPTIHLGLLAEFAKEDGIETNTEFKGKK